MVTSSKPCLIVAFLGFCLFHATQAGAAEDLESLLARVKANLDRIETGGGTVTWKKYGGYFRADTEEGLVFDATFAFDGDKIRCDHTFRYDRPPVKFAWDGKYSFHAPNPPPGTSIYLGTDDPARYSITDGDRIRFKRLMGPSLDIHETLAFLEFTKDINVDSITAEEMFERMRIAEGMNFGAGEITLEAAAKWVEWMKEPDFECNPAASLEPDGTLKVRMDAGEGSVDVCWFDPAQGYNITREQLIFKGRVLDDVQRTFEEISGMWVLKTYDFKRYKVESEELDGWADVEFDKLEINVPVPENTFHASGFGFPAGTRIVDQVAGTTYELKPEVEIPLPAEAAATAEGAEAELPAAAATAESATVEPGEHGEVAEPVTAPATAAASAEGASRWVVPALLVFGCGVAIALALLWAFRRRGKA